MKDIFNEAAVGENFAYFNISSDDEYRLFASKLFSETIVAERVSYEQFNLNLQTLNRLDGVGNKYYLFNPNCSAAILSMAPEIDITLPPFLITLKEFKVCSPPKVS